MAAMTGPPPAPPTNKGRKFPPEPLTTDEVHRLIRAASNRSSSGLRMRGMVAVMFGAGLRLDECLSLEPRDVDTADQTVNVRRGKGAKHRIIGIDPTACAHIDRWLDRRAKLGLTPRQPVFAAYSAGAKGQKLDQRYVRASLNRLAERAGITKRVHPHGLRHSLASDMAATGSSVSQIQRQLGHTSLATTDRYVHDLRPEELIRHMRERTWGDDG